MVVRAHTVTDEAGALHPRGTAVQGVREVSAAAAAGGLGVRRCGERHQQCPQETQRHLTQRAPAAVHAGAR